MAASPARERRPAVWPWLVMPLIVLVVFCALTRVHHHFRSTAGVRPPPAATQTSESGQPSPGQQ